MALKMGVFNPGKGTGMGSAFYKKNEKDLKYRDPAEFSGPGEYAKHTGKWIGGKLKKSMGDLVSGVAATGKMIGSMGKSKKKNKNTVNQQGVPGMGESAMKKTQEQDLQNNKTDIGHQGHQTPRSIDACEKQRWGAIRNKRRSAE